MSPTDTYKKQKCTDGYSDVSKSLIIKWHSRFNDSLTKRAQRGRKSYMNVGNVKATGTVTEGDRRKSYLVGWLFLA